MEIRKTNFPVPRPLCKFFTWIQKTWVCRQYQNNNCQVSEIIVFNNIVTLPGNILCKSHRKLCEKR